MSQVKLRLQNLDVKKTCFFFHGMTASCAQKKGSCPKGTANMGTWIFCKQNIAGEEFFENGSLSFQDKVRVWRVLHLLVGPQLRKRRLFAGNWTWPNWLAWKSHTPGQTFNWRVDALAACNNQERNSSDTAPKPCSLKRETPCIVPCCRQSAKITHCKL